MFDKRRIISYNKHIKLKQRREQMTKLISKEEFRKEFKSLSEISDRKLADHLSICFYLEEPIELRESGLFGNTDVYDYEGHRLGSLKEGDKK